MFYIKTPEVNENNEVILIDMKCVEIPKEILDMESDENFLYWLAYDKYGNSIQIQPFSKCLSNNAELKLGELGE